MNGETYGCVKSFCYLGDSFDGGGGADLAPRIRNGCKKFRRPFVFLSFRAPSLKMQGRVYSSCVKSSMICRSETRRLKADVGLKFERAEMQMELCRLHDTSEELKKLLGIMVWICDKEKRLGEKKAPNDTAYTRWSSHSSLPDHCENCVVLGES